MQSPLFIAAALCVAVIDLAIPATASAQDAQPSQPLSVVPEPNGFTNPFDPLFDASPAAFGLLQDNKHDADHSHTDEMVHLQPGLRADLFEGWFEPWQHSDYSRLGAPYVHLFLTEPAYIDTGLHLEFGFATGDEGTEYEVGAEIEYGLTRRIGVVFEAPYAFINPDDGDSENGVGDLGFAPRFLLLDYDRFLLSANIGFEFPTGDEDRGLGAGETVFAPSLSTWLDLGNNLGAQANIGIEHGVSSGSDAFVWGAALSYTMYLRDAEIISADGAVRAHFPVGTLSLIGEMRGEHPLDGDDEGQGTAMAVIGGSYTFAPLLEFRAGVTFPMWNPREFDVGAIFGIIYHF
jgi:hypothetical protein